MRGIRYVALTYEFASNLLVVEGLQLWFARGNVAENKSAIIHAGVSLNIEQGQGSIMSMVKGQ